MMGGQRQWVPGLFQRVETIDFPFHNLASERIVRNAAPLCLQRSPVEFKGAVGSIEVYWCVEFSGL